MTTLTYLCDRFGLPAHAQGRIELDDFGREGLAHLFGELGFTTGVEIGVQRGEYSAVLCQANPALRLFGIDPWVAYTDYHEVNKQASFDQWHAEAIRRLAPFGSRCVLVRKTSMEAVKDFADHVLDFVYIDGNHSFPSVVNDIFEWSKKVRFGGIISGHDYLERRRPNSHLHVIQAVEGYTKAYSITPWFVLGNKRVVPGQVRDKPRSWCWVNTPLPIYRRG